MIIWKNLRVQCSTGYSVIQEWPKFIHIRPRPMHNFFLKSFVGKNPAIDNLLKISVNCLKVLGFLLLSLTRNKFLLGNCSIVFFWKEVSLIWIHTGYQGST